MCQINRPGWNTGSCLFAWQVPWYRWMQSQSNHVSFGWCSIETLSTYSSPCCAWFKTKCTGISWRNSCQCWRWKLCVKLLQKWTFILLWLQHRPSLLKLMFAWFDPHSNNCSDICLGKNSFNSFYFLAFYIRGCQFYLMSIFLMKIGLFFSMKSDWSIPEKSYNNSNFKDKGFLVILKQNFFTQNV